MQPIKQPSKEVVREYMAKRREAKAPPPERDEVRRQLGWLFNVADEREPAR